MHRIAKSRFRRPAFFLMALSLAAVAVPPEIGGLVPPQAEEPRVIGRNGKTVDAILESDGSVQGAG